MKLCVNTDYSGYVINQTQAQIDAYISAIVSAIPNCTHINVNTYLDYPLQIAKWATSIRNAGKIPWFRSWGYNFWQGTNGADVDNTLDAIANHRSQQQAFIAENASIFRSGDIWSAVPDEVENWDGWDLNYTSLGTVEGKAAYNGFIQSAISECNEAFDLAGITGVDSGYAATNPSTSKNTINTTTANMLTAMLIDAYWDGHSNPTQNYPWGAMVDEHLAASSVRFNINRWVVGSQGGKAYHITTGVSIYKDLTDQQQADSYNSQLFAITKTVPSLEGITLWPAGRTTNPGSALFTHSAGIWTAKPATAIINAYFGILSRGVLPKRKLII